MRLGLDFDNTLVSYDALFRCVALQNDLIPASIAPQKNAVRDYLRAAGREAEWTRLQGEVYGKYILEAAPYEGMLAALHSLTRHAVSMCIVSHKTRKPYLGEAWDLHAAARSWLSSQGFHSATGLGWRDDQVFFELTKDAKVTRIGSEQCTHYVDDLPELLDLLPAHVEKIYFAPADAAAARPEWRVMRTWRELPSLLGIS